jgi:hypothetical protein
MIRRREGMWKAILLAGISTFAYVHAHPAMDHDPLGLMNLVAEGSVNQTPGGTGFTVAAGVYITVNLPGEGLSIFDMGVYRSSGTSTGLNEGAAIQGGFVNGDESTIAGPFTNGNVSIPPGLDGLPVGGSASVLTDSDGVWQGTMVGPSEEAGISESQTTTSPYGLNDAGGDIGSWIYGVTHPGDGGSSTSTGHGPFGSGGGNGGPGSSSTGSSNAGRSGTPGGPGSSGAGRSQGTAEKGLQ